MKFSYDLHIHTCLSPCGDESMTPASVVGMAKLNGLDIMAVCDHNSCKNLPAAFAAAAVYGMKLIAGMELNCAEEIHVICLFCSMEQAMEFDRYVEAHLVKVENNEAIFGRQSVMNENDEELSAYPYLLTNATDISVNEVHTLVEGFGGVAFPAHLDRDSYSLLSVLGFLETEMGFTAIEIFDLLKKEKMAMLQPELLRDYHVLTNSDAHYLENISEPIHFLELAECSAKAVIAKLISVQDQIT